ncbi:MAG: hypothetical protein SF182_03140 [Deltaproteobacteria bacterium]|nr:hypothetical protein [Deltaproteobacteria bacterium]
MTPRGGRRLALAAWLVAVAPALGGAQTTTSEGAALLVFPKVVVDDQWDTAIQLTNTANRPARAICYYVNGALTFPDLPPGPTNPPLWTQVDFRLSLVRQQPTQWVVSRGRVVDDADQVCRAPFTTCSGSGLDPGVIPPVEGGFSGELLCYEVDASGAPWSGNALIGHATLTHRATGALLKYPAVGSVGLPSNDADGTLCLGGEASEVCPSGAEYGGCPRSWTVSHPSDFDERASDGDASATRLVVAPCTHDFVTQEPQSVQLSFLATNEFEQRFSAAARVSCWTDLVLAEVAQIFDRDVIGADWLQTEIRAAGQTPGGFRLVQQTARGAAEPARLSVVATVPPQLDAAPQADLVRVPEESVP